MNYSFETRYDGERGFEYKYAEVEHDDIDMVRGWFATVGMSCMFENLPSGKHVVRGFVEQSDRNAFMSGRTAGEVRR